MSAQPPSQDVVGGIHGLQHRVGKSGQTGDKERKTSGLENFIIVAIVLVIIQTFIAELAVFYRWPVQARTILLILGFFFDLTFTVEFIVRSIANGRKKRFWSYFFRMRGWVDFMSSVPLLFLNSGPLVFLLLINRSAESLAVIGILNILKVVKAIRVTRILRLIRIMKIFGKIKNADSKMAQHHTTTVSTTAVSLVLLVIFAFTFITGDQGVQLSRERETYYRGLTQRLISVNPADTAFTERVLQADRHVLRIYRGVDEVYSGVDFDTWTGYYAVDDYVEIENGEYRIFVSLTDIEKKSAQNNMLIFMIVIVLVLGFMFLYSNHFVQTVSDVIFVLMRGFRERNYSLQVRIPEEYAEHEVFQLARFYNDKFLPAKMKRMHKLKMEKKSQLSMKDVFKFEE